MTDHERANQTMNHKEIDNCIQAYDHVLRLFQMSNDNYFKRTQILMIVIQSGLFVAFSRLILNYSSPGKSLSAISLALIPLIGLLSAYSWALLITRQRNALELCRCYLRGIEARLLELEVPLAYFTYEAMIFYRPSFKCKQKYVRFRDDQKHFPYHGSKVKIGLMNIEEYMAIFLIAFWFACFVTFLCHSAHAYSLTNDMFSKMSKYFDTFIVRVVYPLFLCELLYFLAVYVAVLLRPHLPKRKWWSKSWIITLSCFLILAVSLGLPLLLKISGQIYSLLWNLGTSFALSMVFLSAFLLCIVVSNIWRRFVLKRQNKSCPKIISFPHLSNKIQETLNHIC